MKRIFIFLYFLIPCIAHAKAPFIRGIALGHHTDIKISKLNRTLDELKALNASHVSVVVQWSTRDVRSTTLSPRKDHTTSDLKLVQMLEAIHRKGLKAILFPIIDVQIRKPLEWRGVIKPSNWDDWWNSYRRFILHYARLAEKSNAEVLCVGSELVTTEKMTKRWSQLISTIRKNYHGKLLYSANWDHYDPVSFWKKVDYVGLTAYYTLAKSKTAKLHEMIQSWTKYRDKLVSWAKRKRVRLLFTEVGYPSLDGGAVNPWDYTQETPVDLEEQRLAYLAFTKVWSGVKELSGVVFWDWYGKGGPKDKSYTPRHKPASDVIKNWFKTIKSKPSKRKRKKRSSRS